MEAAVELGRYGAAREEQILRRVARTDSDPGVRQAARLGLQLLNIRRMPSGWRPPPLRAPYPETENVPTIILKPTDVPRKYNKLRKRRYNKFVSPKYTVESERKYNRFREHGSWRGEESMSEDGEAASEKERTEINEPDNFDRE
jgi:hypothetical protein